MKPKDLIGHTLSVDGKDFVIKAARYQMLTNTETMDITKAISIKTKCGHSFLSKPETIARYLEAKNG